MKMAECIRVPLLLLVCSSLFLTLVRPDPGPPPDGPHSPARAPGTAEQPPAPARRRPGGWRLSEEAACREDVGRLCPRQSRANSLALLECLQDRGEVRGRRDL